MTSKTDSLENIHYPDDLRKLDDADLPALAQEIRDEMVQSVSVTGGHLGAGLGVVELTIALHKIFNTPKDRLIWDVGHQAYPHKILTGRRNKMLSLRQKDGLSGFTKRSESDYDPFGTGHSSTSISAGLGMAKASALAEEDRNIISVIGDGAMSAGMAYEAMNNAGAMKKGRLLVILNDNDMSIDRPVGAVSAYLARITSSGSYLNFRSAAKQMAKILPKSWETRAKRWEEYTRNLWSGGTFFEELGFYYVGPIDGHDFDQLLPVLRNIKDAKKTPILLHIVTKKGKGYAPAEAADDKYHGVGKFNVVTGALEKGSPQAPPSYTKVFAESLIQEAYNDKKITAVTAAMPTGTGLNSFAKEFPDRLFDVGIAEQHAVTFAAGMATEGYKPFVALYSTFLQRAYDQVVHDVAIQKLPVRFAIDRAGFVGADGPTHAGSFDIAFLSNLPNFVVMAAADEIELQRMVKTAALIDDRPSAFRYPRGESLGLAMPETIEPLEIGKGRLIQKGKTIALLSYGTRLEETMKAAKQLESFGFSVSVADARFAKPIDKGLVRHLAENHEVLVTIEEGVVGGFGSHVAQYLLSEALLDKNLKLRTLVMKDEFTEHNDPYDMYEDAGLNASGIIEVVFAMLGKSNISKSENH